MGLRCILGHDFGETRTERDREERGDEVVETITEVRECQRCGEREIVSESTEVTSLAPDRGPGVSDDDGRSSGPADTTDAGVTPTDANPPSEPSDAGVRGDRDVDVVIDDTESDEPVEDDAEIIDAGPSTDESPTADSRPTDASAASNGADAAGDRDPGAWPDADETHPAEASGTEPTGTSDWPDHDIDGDTGGDRITVGEAGAVDTADATELYGEEADTAPSEDTEIVDGEPEPAPVDTNGSDAVLETDSVASQVDLSPPARETQREYFCPDCGHAETVGASSMREGDICPECLRGYIDERSVE